MILLHNALVLLSSEARVAADRTAPAPRTTRTALDAQRVQYQHGIVSLHLDMLHFAAAYTRKRVWAHNPV